MRTVLSVCLSLAVAAFAAAEDKVKVTTYVTKDGKKVTVVEHPAEALPIPAAKVQPLVKTKAPCECCGDACDCGKDGATCVCDQEAAKRAAARKESPKQVVYVPVVPAPKKVRYVKVEEDLPPLPVIVPPARPRPGIEIHGPFGGSLGLRLTPPGAN